MSGRTAASTMFRLQTARPARQQAAAPTAESDGEDLTDPMDGFDGVENRQAVQATRNSSATALPGYGPGPVAQEAAAEEHFEATSAEDVAREFLAESPRASGLPLVEARLERARYYHVLLNQDLFSDASEASREVEDEIREFIRSKLEQLMGLRPEERAGVASTQFSEDEAAQIRLLLVPGLAEVLGALAAKVTGQPSKLDRPSERTGAVHLRPAPVPTATATPQVNRAPAPAQTKPRPPPAPLASVRPAPPVKRPAPQTGSKPRPPKSEGLPEYPVGVEPPLNQPYVQNGKKYVDIVSEADGTTRVRKDLTEQVRPSGILKPKPPLSPAEFEALSVTQAIQLPKMFGPTTQQGILAAHLNQG